jgi:hypothetical protein
LQRYRLLFLFFLSPWPEDDPGDCFCPLLDPAPDASLLLLLFSLLLLGLQGSSHLFLNELLDLIPRDETILHF